MASKKDSSKQPTKKDSVARGSGSDVNSDSRRLSDADMLEDKTIEDSFPASDAPSHSPISGAGRTKSEIPSSLPEDFKENTAAQFEYGRKSEASTLHFDRSENRLRKGNPDIGNVDLGTIEYDSSKDETAEDQIDSKDLDRAEGSDGGDAGAANRRTDRAEKRANIDRQNEY